MSLGGSWEARPRSWHETAVDNCGICGRLITTRVWRFADGESSLAVCSPECEELYFSYWKPNYGKPRDDAHN